VFDHVTIRVADLPASEAFYATVLQTLGIERTYTGEELVEWQDFSIAPADAEHPVSRRLHVGFVAPSRERADAFWRAGTEAGHRDDGAPARGPSTAATTTAPSCSIPTGTTSRSSATTAEGRQRSDRSAHRNTAGPGRAVPADGQARRKGVNRMKAVVFHGVGDIRLDEVPDPALQDDEDAIVRLTASAICGTDLHFVRGTMAGMRSGTILGHEGVGVVEELGSLVRNFEPGDRVVVCSTISCGACSYCRAGYYAQCDRANPNGSQAGTAFFGGPEATGSFDGLQAERARIPFAHTGLVALPDEVCDEQAILLSDIFPTGYFGAELAEVSNGDTVVVFGAGPVGVFAVLSARMLGAGRVICVDQHQDRLAMARRAGAETIDFSAEDPIDCIRELTGGIGPDRAIDAVGVDAERAHEGPAAGRTETDEEQFAAEVGEVAPEQAHNDGHWRPGDAPSMVLRWAVRSLAKAGTLAIIGVYPPQAKAFPIGEAMNKNLTLKMGNCNHRRYVPELIELVRAGAVDPQVVLTQLEGPRAAIEAYEAFDLRRPGWIKVELEPAA